MISPIETFIAVGVFVSVGLVEGKRFTDPVECEVYKNTLMEKWENDNLDQYVYYVMCRRDDD